MINRYIFGWILLILISGCSGFEPYSTVSELNKPPTRTIDTHLQSEEVGDSAGNNVHNYMERLAVKIKSDEYLMLKSSVEGLRVTIDSDVLFDNTSHTLKDHPASTEMFKTIMPSKYCNYLIEVHTDGEGTRYFNQGLSERRLESLKASLVAIGFPLERTQLRAYGKDQSIADNSFEWGKKLNRRIEIAIFANDQLKEKAKKGQVFD